MFDIGIREIEIPDCIVETDHITYLAHSAKHPYKCPNCGKKKFLIRNGGYNKTLQDIKRDEKQVYIKLRINRYRCTACNKTTSDIDKLTFFKKRSKFTNRLKEEIVNEVLRGKAFYQIANVYGIEHDTVKAILESYAKEHTECFDYKGTPEILGISDVCIGGHSRLVLADLKKKQLIDIKKDNLNSTLITYLNTLDRETCKKVVINFNPEYAACSEKILGRNKQIIIDKLYATREVDQDIDSIWKKSLRYKYIQKKEISEPEFNRIEELFLKSHEERSREEATEIGSWYSKYNDIYYLAECKILFYNMYKDALKYGIDYVFSEWDTWISRKKNEKTMKNKNNKNNENLSEKLSSIRNKIVNQDCYIKNYISLRDADKYSVFVRTIYDKVNVRQAAGRNCDFNTFRTICFLSVNTRKKIPQKKSTSGNSRETPTDII